MLPTASPDVGHVYVVHTTLTRPIPKDKIVICIRSDHPPLFVWFNTTANAHGMGQLPCMADDHAALAHDCYLDLSRVTTFQPKEIAAAQHRGAISDALKQRIHAAVAAGIDVLPDRHAAVILASFALP